SSTCAKLKLFDFEFQAAIHRVPSNMLVIWATGGSARWENMTSTGAALEGEGFRETLWVERTFPLLASRTVTVSPGSPKSAGLTVLVISTRSILLWMLIPCG